MNLNCILVASSHIHVIFPLDHHQPLLPALGFVRHNSQSCASEHIVVVLLFLTRCYLASVPSPVVLLSEVHLQRSMHVAPAAYQRAGA